MHFVKRVYVAHTINTVALSIISIYVPAYLLTHGYSLLAVIGFFAISHTGGLLYVLTVFPVIIKKWGLLRSFQLYYPLQILYLFLLSTLHAYYIPLTVIAVIGGVANFAYWMPMNIFLIQYSQPLDMGGNLANFFALPQIFSILGPLLSAVLIPFVGFWPVFGISMIGLICSFIPLINVGREKVTFTYSISTSLQRFSRNKMLFFFEFLDNIIEESEWFWGIYAFLIIGSLTAPGIVGALQAIGGALFTIFVGKMVHKHGWRLIPVAAFLLLGLTLSRMIVVNAVGAYVITVTAAFVLMLFLVSYFSTVYKKVKNDNEEEFMILREISTVLGRLVVFAGIYVTAANLRYFFLLPLVTIIIMIILYLWKGKKTFGPEEEQQLETTLRTV